MSWVLQEARKLIPIADSGRKVVLQMGYSASGLPHIGTFGEVVRTNAVRQALMMMRDCDAEMICYSDDLDALLKVPDDMPDGDILSEYIGVSLDYVPDPDRNARSFGEANNIRFRKFIDQLGISYKFLNSAEMYRSGVFNDLLLKILHLHKEIIEIVAPELGEKRRATYSPFMPICQRTGRIFVGEIHHHPESSEVSHIDPESGEKIFSKVTDGHCKLQWRVDWAMRWVALGVDYEMYGKDLIDALSASHRICQLLSGNPPLGCHYQMFIDEDGRKISKSKGNGITVSEWQQYGPKESLMHLMIESPQRPHRMFYGMLAERGDRYIIDCNKHLVQKSDGGLKLDDKGYVANDIVANTVYFLPEYCQRGAIPLSFSTILGLVTACQSEDASIIWGMVDNAFPAISSGDREFVMELIGLAINYYRDFIAHLVNKRPPSDQERQALSDLYEKFSLLEDFDQVSVQTAIYDVGHAHGFQIKDWFCGIYEVLFGQSAGPRLGSFFSIYGREKTRQIIRQALQSK